MGFCYFILNEEPNWVLVALGTSILLIVTYAFGKETNSKHHKEVLEEAIDNTKQNNYFVDELVRKNREIDELHKKLKNSISEEERLKEFSSEVEIVKETEKILHLKGIDEELSYLESIDFDKDIEKAGVLISFAKEYKDTNRLKKAETSYNEALKLIRGLVKEKPISYNKFIATILSNLALLYNTDNRIEDAEEAYNETLNLYVNLVENNPSAYGILYADTLVMGVDKLNQPIENLNEAENILSKFGDVHKTKVLLGIIDELKKKI